MQKSDVKFVDVWGVERRSFHHWSAKISSLHFSCESFVEFRIFRTIPACLDLWKTEEITGSFVDDLSKQSQPVSTRRRRWKTHERCYAFNQAFLHYPCNRTAYNISMSKKDLAWQLRQHGNYVRDAWVVNCILRMNQVGVLTKMLVDSLEALLRSLRGHIPVSEKKSCLIDQVSYVVATLVFLQISDAYRNLGRNAVTFKIIIKCQVQQLRWNIPVSEN